jgi:hypothetical protein
VVENIAAAISVAVFGSREVGSNLEGGSTRVVFGRGVTDEADLDGPSFEATRAFLFKNRLYSYFAGRI